MATGLAAVRAYLRDGIFGRAAALEAKLRARLEPLAEKHAIVGDVRGVGAFFAVEFVSDRAKRTPLVPWQGKNAGIMPALFAGLNKRGVYAFGRYNVLHIAPPLIVEDDQLDELAAAIDAAIGDLAEAYAKAK